MLPLLTPRASRVRFHSPLSPPDPTPVVASNALKCFFVKTSYTLQFALNPTWLWPGIAPLGRLQTGRPGQTEAGQAGRAGWQARAFVLCQAFNWGRLCLPPFPLALPLAVSLFLCLCANPLAVAWQLKGIFMAKTYLFYTHTRTLTHIETYSHTHEHFPACLTPAHLARLIFDF